MPALSNALVRLADAYEKLLFEGELSRRLSHHMALVASERWLAVELAMLVNERAADVGLPGWSAIVEKGVVDVSLIPPDTDPRQPNLPSTAICLELKLISPEYWTSNWKEVRADLAGRSSKTKADYAVCFLLDHLSPSLSARQPRTQETYRAYQASIPHGPAAFTPIAGEPMIELLRSSDWHGLNWPHPVACRWPEGFGANMRILWITEPGRTCRLQAMLDAAGV
jgi:hypothetical protein